MSRYLLLLGTALIWGSQFLLNNWALQAASPLVIALARTVIGALTLTVLVALMREPKAAKQTSVPAWKHHGYFAVVGLFEATLPMVLIIWGQKVVPSSIASILVSSVPIFTVLFIVLFFRSEPVSWNKVLAVILGFAGIIVLLLPGLDWLAVVKNTYLLWPELAILAGAASFAMSLLLLRRVTHLPPIRTARTVLSWAAVELAIVVLLTPQTWHVELDPLPWVAILLLGLFCAGIVYLMFLQLIRRAGATFASFCNYLIPVVGLILGITILHERFSLHEGLGLVILLLAMALNELRA